jgi:hypothetical protein
MTTTPEITATGRKRHAPRSSRQAHKFSNTALLIELKNPAIMLLYQGTTAEPALRCAKRVE